MRTSTGTPFMGTLFLSTLLFLSNSILAEEPAEGPAKPDTASEQPGENAPVDDAPAPAQAKAAVPHWLSNYGDAVHAARDGRKMLLILFTNPEAPERAERYRDEILGHPELAEALSKYVLLEVPTNSAVETEDGPCVLLTTGPMEEMLGLDGVAMGDYIDPDSENYGKVVSVFPFVGGRTYDLRETKVMLELPPGSLTQRTLIYAVRTHPEGPQSTRGQFNPNLRREARFHSGLMARLRRSGHHQWETRFHRINGQIPGGLTATEVAAESWPGQRLLAAAVECVRCWRLSSGHWRAVRAAHPCYGYDMKQGANGVWYATGLFGSRQQY